MTYRGTVTDIIEQVIAEMQLHDNARFALSILAIDFLRDLNNDTVPTIKTERYGVPPNRIIPIPKDFIDWTKAATQFKEGIKLLAYNFQMSKGVSTANLPSITEYGNPFLLQTDSSNYPFMYMYGYGPTGGRIQAFGNGGDLGSFSIDPINKVIRLIDNYPFQNFYLEYLSDCMEHNDDTVVHPYCITAMKTCMKYNYLKNRKDPFYRAYETDVLIELKEMRNRFLNLSAETIRNVVEQQWGGIE
jgi:hypothetical protein